MKKSYITATFLVKKNNTTFEIGFNGYTEFYKYMAQNPEYVLLRIEYAD